MTTAILAWLGNAEAGADVVLAAERHRMIAVDQSPGRLIFASENVRVNQKADGRIIIGDCFDDSKRSPTPEPCWGNFLAFSANGRRQSVERAALTGLPLYWRQRPDGVLLASDERLMPQAATVSVDWDFVAHTLAFINLRSEQTGMAGLRELLPGTRIDCEGGCAAVVSTWCPWDFVAQPTLGDLADIASDLERRIIDCTAAWSATRRDIIVELSGGLDSSIVTAALAAASADFSAITFATPDAEGDERRYARAVASHYGITLIEVEHDDQAIDLAAPLAEASARPGAYSVLGGLDLAFTEAVPDRSRPIFGGIGGDSVFHLDSTIAPVIDAYASFGASRQTFETMRDVARASGATVWEAARLAWRAHRAGPRIGWRRDTDYLNEARLPSAPYSHPWDGGAEQFSQAKRNHVESVRRILDFLDRPRRWLGRETFAPLLSRPVVELCLSISSGTWFTGGRNRAVARAAFARRLPADVVWRRGKGRMEALCAAAYLRQRTGLKELLLAGQLAERGLLDLPAIKSYLDRDLVEGNFDYFRLIEIADVERWVRAVESEGRAGFSFAHR